MLISTDSILSLGDIRKDFILLEKKTDDLGAVCVLKNNKPAFIFMAASKCKYTSLLSTIKTVPVTMANRNLTNLLADIQYYNIVALSKRNQIKYFAINPEVIPQLDSELEFQAWTMSVNETTRHLAYRYDEQEEQYATYIVH